jgi:PadR family transcriptional regulator, regulatory protein AphA
MPRQTSPLSIEYILLGLLETEPAHGYDLYRRLNGLEAVGMVWSIKQSQLYALLERLEYEGLVTSAVIPGSIHPDRKQYSITPSGRASFTNWKASPVQHGREMRMVFLAKLYFAHQTGASESIRLVDSQQRLCSEWLGNMKKTLDGLPSDQKFPRIVLAYRISQTKAMADWLTAVSLEIK